MAQETRLLTIIMGSHSLCKAWLFMEIRISQKNSLNSSSSNNHSHKNLRQVSHVDSINFRQISKLIGLSVLLVIVILFELRWLGGGESNAFLIFQFGQIIDIRAMISDATRLNVEDGVDSSVSVHNS